MIHLLRQGIAKGVFSRTLYKFIKFDDYTDKIIENSELYFSSPMNFNDPFDCNLSFRQRYSHGEIKQRLKSFKIDYPNFPMAKLRETFGTNTKKFASVSEKFTREAVRKSGILSLTRDNTNITMWSHYAHNHTGLVLELDVEEDFDFFVNYGNVIYKEEYDLLSYARNRNDSLAQLFTTKYTDWAYENEVRIMDFTKNGTKRFKKSVLKNIYFGCKSDVEKREHIIDLCKKNGFEHVNFYKAQIVQGEFSIKFNQLKK